MTTRRAGVAPACVAAIGSPASARADTRLDRSFGQGGVVRLGVGGEDADLQGGAFVDPAGGLTLIGSNGGLVRASVDVRGVPAPGSPASLAVPVPLPAGHGLIVDATAAEPDGSVVVAYSMARSLGDEGEDFPPPCLAEVAPSLAVADLGCGQIGFTDGLAATPAGLLGIARRRPAPGPARHAAALDRPGWHRHRRPAPRRSLGRLRRRRPARWRDRPRRVRQRL